jgi:hypothetical protein
LINHGLSEEFLNIPQDLPKKYEGINIGLSGNFLFNDIDYPILLQIVAENPNVKFHFYGNNSLKSNIGADSSQRNFGYLTQIKRNSNCIFHGILGKRELALELNQMDGFLICYDPQKGQSRGSNSHKILEFLSTGKVIFSSYFSFYDGTDLFVMNSNMQSNSALLEYFRQGQNEFKVNNSASSISKRKDFAIQRSYDSNLKKIMSVKLPIPSCAE